MSGCVVCVVEEAARTEAPLEERNRERLRETLRQRSAESSHRLMECIKTRKYFDGTDVVIQYSGIWNRGTRAEKSS